MKKFSELANGELFTFNGTTFKKKSSRTAFISQAVKPRHLWRGYKAALACEPVLRNTAVYISSVITQSRQL